MSVHCVDHPVGVLHRTVNFPLLVLLPARSSREKTHSLPQNDLGVHYVSPRCSRRFSRIRLCPLVGLYPQFGHRIISARGCLSRAPFGRPLRLIFGSTLPPSMCLGLNHEGLRGRLSVMSPLTAVRVASTASLTACWSKALSWA